MPRERVRDTDRRCLHCGAGFRPPSGESSLAFCSASCYWVNSALWQDAQRHLEALRRRSQDGRRGLVARLWAAMRHGSEEDVALVLALWAAGAGIGQIARYTALERRNVHRILAARGVLPARGEAAAAGAPPAAARAGAEDQDERRRPRRARLRQAA